MDDIVEQLLPTSAGTISYKVVIILLHSLKCSFLYQTLLWITVGQLYHLICVYTSLSVKHSDTDCFQSDHSNVYCVYKNLPEAPNIVTNN